MPFTLSPSQLAAIQGITADITRKKKATTHLLQGDVGSGKTAVAMEVAKRFTRSTGRQVALLAPTTALANQHSETARGVFPRGATETITGASSGKKKDKQEREERIADGRATLVIGTQAIAGLRYRDLGLVIVDEQQKFGAEATLAMTGRNTHTLLMTATAIPRTFTQALFGVDGIKTTILEHRKGTSKTGKPKCSAQAMNPKTTRAAHRDCHARTLKGGQAFLVFASIHEPDEPGGGEDGLLSLEEGLYAYQRTTKADVRTLGMLHGKMTKDEQQHEMLRFTEGKTRALFTTSIVEVGINCGLADTMVVHNAERFGAAQLHQIKGRVGRSQQTRNNSKCTLLYTDKGNKDAQHRVDVAATDTDGEGVAMSDTLRRGPGNIYGTAQSGYNLTRKILE